MASLAVSSVGDSVPDIRARISLVSHIVAVSNHSQLLPDVFRKGEDDTEVSTSRIANCTKLCVTWSHPEVVLSITAFNISLIGTLHNPRSSAMTRIKRRTKT